ncbi:hypothetical protein F3X87_11720 [Aeromonas caviae]|uniref:hypothetical protein n=1 Tax=Aeromonas caviae TaxID=648 RepID=UPI00124938BD|nr:hypothetical protein [Aeromonas caviae]KAB0678292.1 hypothetical protein F3X87_11720 [Aeromonas caviae]
MLEVFFSVVNTLLLVILFFYQKNRNQVLTEHLSAQRRLIDETKSVVIQQATALEGQGKVVETALKYSEAFDPTKLETIIRREIDVEYKEKIENLKKEFEGRNTQTVENIEKLVNGVVVAVSTSAAEATLSFIEPMLPHVIRSLVSMPKDERAEEIALLPESLRNILLDGAEQIDQRIREHMEQHP